MAKRIGIFSLPGKTVEAVPHGNTYPTGAITIPENTTVVAGGFSLYEKNDVADAFSGDGIADIYESGILKKAIIYNPDLVIVGSDW